MDLTNAKNLPYLPFMRPTLKPELDDTAKRIKEMREAHKAQGAPFPPMKNDLLLRTMKGEKADSLPIWIMRYRNPPPNITPP